MAAAASRAIMRMILGILLVAQLVLQLSDSNQVDASKHTHQTGFALALAGAFAPLTLDYYKETCPAAEKLISSFIANAVDADRSFAAAVLRLHFHDCFVHGCDGSVLINSPPNATNVTAAEKDSIANKGTLRGFAVVDQLKALLEAACPGVVSCADILALSARDAVVRVGGRSWVVPLGRRDGLVSSALAANANLPSPFANYSGLVQNFAAKNLTAKDMVVLSGSHTIGQAHCGVVTRRLYNSTAPGAINGVDADLNPTFAASLKQQCPPNNTQNIIAMDPTRGNNTFDKNYFVRLLDHEGAFRSDSTLVTDPTGLAIVTKEASRHSHFGRDFGLSMIKMGLIPIPTGDGSNVRRQCFAFN